MQATRSSDTSTAAGSRKRRAALCDTTSSAPTRVHRTQLIAPTAKPPELANRSTAAPAAREMRSYRAYSNIFEGKDTFPLSTLRRARTELGAGLVPFSAGHRAVEHRRVARRAQHRAIRRRRSRANGWHQPPHGPRGTTPSVTRRPRSAAPVRQPAPPRPPRALTRRPKTPLRPPGRSGCAEATALKAKACQRVHADGGKVLAGGARAGR